MKLERVAVTQRPSPLVSMANAACQRSTLRSAQKTAAATGSLARSGTPSRRPCSAITYCPPCSVHHVVLPLALMPSTTKIIDLTTPATLGALTGKLYKTLPTPLYHRQMTTCYCSGSNHGRIKTWTWPKYPSAAGGGRTVNYATCTVHGCRRFTEQLCMRFAVIPVLFAAT